MEKKFKVTVVHSNCEVTMEYKIKAENEQEAKEHYYEYNGKLLDLDCHGDEEVLKVEEIK